MSAIVNEGHDRVLADVAHDLANRFHRYYYYADLAVDSLSDESAEARELLAKALETVEGIEALTRQTMSFVRPIQLRTIRVCAGDVIGSLRQHLGERALEWEDEACGGDVLAVDPARLGEVFATCCRLLLAHAVAEAPLRLESAADVCLELRMSIAAVSPLPPAPDLALAAAARIVALHGGQLAIPETDDPGRAALTLRLPLAAKE